MLKRLEGKIALVTGGASGIGAATVQQLASDGAIVIVADLMEEAGKALADKVSGTFVHLDVASEESWGQAMELASTSYGRIDILVNAAGIAGDVVNGAFDRMTLADWRKVMSINLDGTFLGCRAVLQLMSIQGQGAIVNLASVASFYPTPQNAAYGSSKAGVMQLTKTVAAFGAGKGNIRCNSVHPGQIATPMLTTIRDQIEVRDGAVGLAAVEASINRIPLGEGRAEDVAHLISFLVSDDARYITGGEFTVDGGWRLLR